MHRNFIIRRFIAIAVMFVSVNCLDATESAANSFNGTDYAALRKQLRAFYPDECHDRCKDPSYMISEKAINADLDEYAASHPGYDALDLRQACYRSMQKHFVPYLFAESPFYFEAGVNGGWIFGKAPARGVNRLCWKFYREQGLVPDEEFKVLNARQREALSLCCGPFRTICTMCRRLGPYWPKGLAVFVRKWRMPSRNVPKMIRMGENS